MIISNNFITFAVAIDYHNIFMDISVIVPLYNEAESLPVLHDWIVRVMQAHQYTYEILFINDGSSDSSWQVIKQLRDQNEHVRGICFRRNYGKSAAPTFGEFSGIVLYRLINLSGFNSI